MPYRPPALEARLAAALLIAAAAASFTPAWNASRLPLRNVLIYK